MQPSRDFSLRGAVDLGARHAAAQRRQQAAQAADSGAQPAHVIDVTDQTFNTDVAERSRSVPVVLDLWAEWCGPCKQLSPVLEKLAAEAAGAWILAKVDVDANPQLSAALQVQSIPMVVAVVAGQVVDGFLGALPETSIREWLGQILQVAQQLGLPAAQAGAAAAAADGSGPAGTAGAAGPQAAADGQLGSDPGFSEAQQALERGDLDGAGAAFEKVLESSPGQPAAVMGLAQVKLIRRVSSYDRAKAVRQAQDNPDDPAAQARAADIEVATGNAEAGFSRLLETVRRTSGEDRNQARLHLLLLFEAFPPRDPAVTSARATLSSLLF